ncbi:ferredoxin [Mesobacillus subterraneus]|uniref:Ferredoxin n=2 Tax=Bacillaceae TaxID=186817 RepID=A0A0D6ZGD0_9BACI|nr:ferredoxin [Mesobacillus subterraneus]
MGGQMAKGSSLLHTIQHCEATCEDMVTHLIGLQNDDRRDVQILLLRDCADMCTLMAKYLARNSFFSKTLANICAYICEQCAMECSKYPDQMSQNCAQVCQHCAQACRAFAA